MIIRASGSALEVTAVGALRLPAQEVASFPLAEIADKLSRKDNNFKGRTNRVLTNGIFQKVESCLTDWLQNPGESSLCERILKEAGMKHPNLCFAE